MRVTVRQRQMMECRRLCLALLRLACSQTVIPATDRRPDWFLAAGILSSYKPLPCEREVQISPFTNKCLLLSSAALAPALSAVCFPFAYSAIGKADLHKRLLLTMWNSNSKTRYLLVVLC